MANYNIPDDKSFIGIEGEYPFLPFEENANPFPLSSPTTPCLFYGTDDYPEIPFLGETLSFKLTNPVPLSVFTATNDYPEMLFGKTVPVLKKNYPYGIFVATPQKYAAMSHLIDIGTGIAEGSSIKTLNFGTTLKEVSEYSFKSTPIETVNSTSQIAYFYNSFSEDTLNTIDTDSWVLEGIILYDPT